MYNIMSVLCYRSCLLKITAVKLHIIFSLVFYQHTEITLVLIFLSYFHRDAQIMISTRVFRPLCIKQVSVLEYIIIIVSFFLLVKHTYTRPALKQN